MVASSLRKIRQLNDAIKSLDYDKVAEFLSDPQVPVNLASKIHQCFPIDLPLAVVFCVKDPKMARLFLECPRIDWHASYKNLIRHNLGDEFGIQYESEILVPYSYKPPDWTPFNAQFIAACPDEADKIIEKMIRQFINIRYITDYDYFLFETCSEWTAFKVALTFSSNIESRNQLHQTLLHAASDVNVTKFLIENGLDVNSLDYNGYTPLMHHSRHRHSFELIAFLIAHGADVNFVNSNGISVLNTCPWFISFANRYKISERLLIDRLKKDFGKERFKYVDLKTLFENYTASKQVFESNLLVNICLLEDMDETEYFRDLSDHDYLSVFKNMIIHRYDYNFKLFNRFELIQRHANELLHFAAERASFSNVIDDLISHFKANPDGKVNGKTPLFVSSSENVKKLLALGANPFIECDGLKFFEDRIDFFLDRDLAGLASNGI